MSEMLKTRHLTGALPPCALVRALPPGLIGGLIGPVSICFHNKQSLFFFVFYIGIGVQVHSVLLWCDKVVRKERWRLSLESYDSSSHL